MAKSACLIILGLIGSSSLQSMETSALVNIKNNASYTPLHSAIPVGNKEVVKTLVLNGASVHACTPTGLTPLMLCAEYNKDKIARFLLKKGARVDQINSNKMTALHIACKKGSHAVIEPLVMAGAVADADAMNYAMAFKEFNDLSVISALRGALRKRLEAQQANDGFALHRACQAETPTGIEELVLQGMKTDTPDEFGNSPVHYAAVNPNSEIIKTLFAAIEKQKTIESTLISDK